MTLGDYMESSYLLQMNSKILLNFLKVFQGKSSISTYLILYS